MDPIIGSDAHDKPRGTMKDKQVEVPGRRDFLKKSIQTAAAMTVSTGIVSRAGPAAANLVLSDAIPTRVLGRTGVELPMLGCGGAALNKVSGNPLPYEERVKVARYTYERGVRYFDTAGNYQESQVLLGEALKDVRDRVFLTSKVEVTQAEHTRKAFEKILGELQTDYLDAILIHGTPGLEQMTVTEAMNVHGELVKLRDEGMVRHIGFSAHSYFDKALALIESDGFDLCMLSYGYIPRGWNQIWSARMTALRDTCLAKAHQRNMGIVAMKVVGAGVLGAWAGYIVPEFDEERRKRLPAAAIRHVLRDERVQLLTIGMRLRHEVDQNMATLVAASAYGPDDRALLAEFSAKALDRDPLRGMQVE